MQNFDRFLLAVVYDIPVSVLAADRRDGLIVYANSHALARHGDDALGRRFAEVFPGAGAALHFLSFGQRPQATDDAPAQSEYFDDEREHWYHVLQRDVSWIDGSAKRVFVLNEIDALKAMQKQLSEAHAELALKNRALQQAARTDALTGLDNRRQLDEALQSACARSRRSGAALAALLLDCDHFKAVNDQHGHAVGDAVLVETARRLRLALRGTDMLGRWGGEEFLVLLPDTAEEGAMVLAEKLRDCIAASPFATVGPRSISIGVALWRPDETPAQLMARADAALYRAKAAGRNRALLAD